MARPTRSVTLHLLQSLDALLAECSVSRAAARTGVSQSTMSNNLADLRHLFGDPLLVRQGPGLVATPRALAIIGPIRDSLQQITNAVNGWTEFQPQNARRLFSILTADFVQPLLTLPLVERWSALSDDLDLAVLPLRLDTLQEQLASGQADIAILKRRFAPKTLRHTKLYADRFVLLAHRAHALARESSLENYLDASHVMASPMGPSYPSSVDEALHALGHERNVRVCVPQYPMAAELACTAQMVATVPASIAATLMQDSPLVMRELPFTVPELEVLLVWHERSQNEPAHQWLRAGLRALIESILPPPQEPAGTPTAC